MMDGRRQVVVERLIISRRLHHCAEHGFTLVVSQVIREMTARTIVKFVKEN